MKEKRKVLGTGIDICTAKQAMKDVLRFMDSEPISVIEVLRVTTLMDAMQDEALKENIENMDLVLPGEKKILEEIENCDRRVLQEVQAGTHLKMILRYLKGNHLRVYFLLEERDTDEFLEKVKNSYLGLQVTGVHYVTEDQPDDFIVNAINGAEADCVISLLSSPLQEDFIIRNRNNLNARIWIGGGRILKELMVGGRRRQNLLHMLTVHIFRKEMKKDRKAL